MRGRLSKGMNEEARKFISSLKADEKIAETDIDLMEAHNLMLFKQGMMSKEEISKILNSFEKARNDLRNGKLRLDDEEQVDVHPIMEKYVIEDCGIEIGGKTHLGKSRNDQVMTDVRISVRNDISDISESLLDLIDSLMVLADEHKETIMPGYTHLQHAQVTTYSHYLLSYVDVFLRDVDRLYAIYDRVNRSPLGSSALAGTSLKIDRGYVAELLGFDGIIENNLDATSNRDFILEFSSELVIITTTLSRMATDLINWSTFEFGMVEFDDEFADVSSVMPQKKNPCTAEMVRGKTGRAIGLLMQLFATVDKLSTGYGLELQEMNACLWELIDIVRSSIKIMNGIITSLKIKKERMLEVSIKNNIMAVDLAEFIAKNISFREAHSFVGNIVKDLISSSKDLSKIGSDYIKEESERILGFPLLEISDDELKEIIDPSSSISRRDNIGGPAPSEIFRMLSARKEEIDEKKKYLFEKRKNIESAERMLRETVNKNI